MAKDFLKENNVEYTEFNVAEDAEKRQEMVEKSGQMGVPVILIGEDFMVGFNEDKMKESLGL